MTTGRFEDKHASAAAAQKMAELLQATVKACQEDAERLSRDLESAMRLDNYKASRKRLIWRTVFNVVLAAAYCVPGGPLVSAIIAPFRSMIAKQIGSTIEQFDDAFGGMAATVAKVAKSAARELNESIDPRIKQYLEKGGEYLESAEVTDEAKEKRVEIEEDIAETTETLEEFTTTTVVSSDPEGAFAEVHEVFTQILRQLKQVSLGGKNGHTSYVLSQFMAGIEIKNKGAQIARLGGLKTSFKGKERLALGPAEVEAAKNDSGNFLANMWDKSTWIYDTTFVDFLKKMDPAARDSYKAHHWDERRVDKILLFKTFVSAYQTALQDAVVKQDLGSTVGALLKQCTIDAAHFDDHYQFDGNHSPLGSTDRNAAQLSLRLDKPTPHGYQERYGYANKDYIKKTALDSYIFHEILIMHLGTPWVASLPNNKDTRAKVEFALADALITIALCRESSTNDRADRLPKMVGSYPILCGAPSLWTYWAYLPNDTTPRAIFKALGPQVKHDPMLALQSITEATIKDLARTMPYHSSNKGLVDPKLLELLKTSLQAFSDLVNGLANARVVDAKNDSKLKPLISHWDKALKGVGTPWSVAKGAGTNDNALAGFVARVRDNPQANKALIDKYEKRAQEAGVERHPVLAAFLAQEMGMELLVSNAIDTREALLLIHRTIEQLVEVTYDVPAGRRKLSVDLTKGLDVPTEGKPLQGKVFPRKKIFMNTGEKKSQGMFDSNTQATEDVKKAVGNGILQIKKRQS